MYSISYEDVEPLAKKLVLLESEDEVVCALEWVAQAVAVLCLMMRASPQDMADAAALDAVGVGETG